MPIKLAITGRPLVVLDETCITLGSAAGCSVTFDDLPEVRPKHAVIRSVAGRWLLEVRDAKSILIGGSEPKRLHWLAPGDVFRLSENAPLMTFEPDEVGHNSASSPKTTSAAEVDFVPDSDSSIPIPKEATISSPFWTFPEPKATSSPAIKALPLPLSATYDLMQPPSSEAIRVSNSSPADSTTSVSETRRSGPKTSLPTGMTSRTGQETGIQDSVHPSEPSEEIRKEGNQSNGVSDVQWIKTLVGRSIFAGFVIVLLWIAAREIWRAVVPPNYGQSSPTQVNV